MDHSYEDFEEFEDDAPVIPEENTESIQLHKELEKRFSRLTDRRKASGFDYDKLSQLSAALMASKYKKSESTTDIPDLLREAVQEEPAALAEDAEITEEPTAAEEPPVTKEPAVPTEDAEVTETPTASEELTSIDTTTISATEEAPTLEELEARIMEMIKEYRSGLSENEASGYTSEDSADTDAPVKTPEPVEAEIVNEPEPDEREKTPESVDNDSDSEPSIGPVFPEPFENVTSGKETGKDLPDVKKNLPSILGAAGALIAAAAAIFYLW